MRISPAESQQLLRCSEGEGRTSSWHQAGVPQESTPTPLVPSREAPTARPSPLWLPPGSMEDTPTGSNMKAPLRCGVHVFILKSFRLARISP